MAFANPHITAYAVEATEFPDLARRYTVNGVPKTVVNDEVEILGALPQDDFIEQALQLPSKNVVRRWLLALALVSRPPPHPLFSRAPSSAAEPVRYRFSFPEPSQRWMQVRRDVCRVWTAAPLQLRISRSSPGRYALHDFAKNVYDVHAYDARRPRAATRAARRGRMDGPAHRDSVTHQVQGLRRSRRRHVPGASTRATHTSTCRRRSCGRAASTIARSR